MSKKGSNKHVERRRNMENKSVIVVLSLLCISVYLSMSKYGWDWFGGFALILGILAVLRGVKK